MSDDSTKRLASEILLSLEDKVNSLVKIVSVYDFNTKLILDRVNKMYAYINKLENETIQEQTVQTQFPQTQIKKPEIIQPPTEHLITIEDNPKGQRRTARVETYTAPQSTPQIAQPTQTKQSKTDSDRKVPVVQRVTDHAGKDLFMAEVIVLNADKELISKTKTNAAGKWQAYLKPGLYTVNIVKTDTQTKNKLEAMQDITVSNSDTTITLPVMMIKR
jgi:hypothetical protein